MTATAEANYQDTVAGTAAVRDAALGDPSRSYPSAAYSAWIHAKKPAYIVCATAMAQAAYADSPPQVAVRRLIPV